MTDERAVLEVTARLKGLQVCYGCSRTGQAVREPDIFQQLWLCMICDTPACAAHTWLDHKGRYICGNCYDKTGEPR